MGVGGTVGNLLFPGVGFPVHPGVRTTEAWVLAMKLSAHVLREEGGGVTWLKDSRGMVVYASP